MGRRSSSRLRSDRKNSKNAPPTKQSLSQISTDRKSSSNAPPTQQSSSQLSTDEKTSVSPTLSVISARRTTNRNLKLRRLSDTPNFYLSNNQMADLKRCFEIFDVDCTGFIGDSELRVAIRALGIVPKKEDIDSHIADIVKDRSRRIAFDDFLKIMKNEMTKKEPIDEMIKAFRLMDLEKTGKITFQNLKAINRFLGEDLNDEELHEMIYEADLNEDGTVDVEEYKEIIKNACL